MFLNQYIRPTFLALALAVGTCSATLAADTPSREKDIPLLLGQLRTVLIAVQGEIKKQNLPVLKSVQINLETGLIDTVNGKVAIIISVGDTVTNETVQSLKITLTPPPPPPPAQAQLLAGSINFPKEFAKAIISAAESVNSALKSSAEPKLVLNSLSASIKFTFKNTVQAGIDTGTLLPITIQAGGSVTPSTTQEAVLTFEKPGSGGH
jgi:hypothetical protein